MEENRVSAPSNIATNSTNETHIHVLCVDDETSLLETTKNILELQSSFQVETASSVDEALQKMKEKTFDVVVSDYQMPIKTGLDFLQELRKKGNTMPFILFTGKGREEVAVKALNLGADRYFNKIGHPETVYGELAHSINQAYLQRKAEKKIWDREERLRAIVASSPDAMIITDLHGKITECNLETLKLLKVQSKKEILGNDCHNFISKNELQKLQKSVDELLKKGEVNNIESKLLTLDGNEIDVEFCANTLKDAFGEAVGIIFLTRNITERKKTEQGLAKERDTLEKVTGNLNAFLAMISKDHQILWANNYTKKLMGDVTGKTCYKTFNGLDQVCPGCKAKEVFKTGKQIEHERIVTNPKLGTLILNIISIPIKDENGNVNEVLELAIDITERKKAEDVLARERDALEKVTGNLSAAVALISDDHKILWANKLVESYLGDVKGKTCYSTLAYKNHECSKCKLKQVFETGEQAIHHQIIRNPKGEEYLFQNTTIPIKNKNGKVTEVLELAVDITKRKKIEEELTAERDTLEKVTGNLSAALVMISKDLRVQWTNEYLNCRVGDVTGQFCHSALNRLDSICPGCKIQEVIETGKQAVFEITVHNPKGQNLPEGQDMILEITAIPIKDKNDNVTEILELAIDITERKKMEDAIREAEEKHKVLIDSANVMIISVDGHGKYNYVNNEWKRLFGYSDEEIKQITIMDTVRSDHKNNCLKDAELVAKGTAVNGIETVFVTKDGKEIHARGNARPIFNNGKVISTVGVFLDVTEHQKAQEELKESEKRFRELSELLPEVVFESNAKGFLTFVNHAAFKQFGYSKEEFEKGLTPSQFISPQDRERAISNLAKLMAGEETGPNEYLAIRKDGTTFPVTIKSTPIIHKGKTLGIRGIMVDLTEHMKTQKRLKMTLNNLEKSNEKLSVVGKISRHDVKNKLSIILNNAFLIRNQLSEKQTTPLKQLEDIEVAIEQIEKILDFARIYEILGTQEKTTIDVKTILDEAFMLAFQSSEVELVNECENLTVQADSLMRQVFYNLIENSKKHGEKVTQIKVNFKEEKNALKIIYSDNGIGIPETEKEKIFQEGYGKGTGYGLYLIRKICDEYGWTITEDGEPGKGAKFVISIVR